MEFQTRSIEGDIHTHHTFEDALNWAHSSNDVEKISFTILETNERIRLIRSPNGWILEDVFGDRKI